MPTNTPDQGIPLPVGGDTGNVPSDLTSMIGVVEPRLVKRYASAADRTAKNPTPAEGEMSYLLDVNELDVCTVGGATPTWTKYAPSADVTALSATVAALGASSAWTPTLADVTLGAGGTVTGSYSRLNALVIGRVRIVFAAGFAFGADPRVILPVAPVGYTDRHPMGNVTFFDTSAAASWGGQGIYRAADLSLRFRMLVTANTNRQDVPTAAAVPFVWAAPDEVMADFAYLAA